MELKRHIWLTVVWLPLIAFLGCGIVWPLCDLFRLPFMENGHYVSGIKNFEIFFPRPACSRRQSTQSCVPPWRRP